MLLVTCPHCQQLIEIIAINCAIFRCGIYKATGEQLSPHLPKSECDRVVTDDLVYGCAKPFRIVQHAEQQYVAEACDYI